MTAEAQLEQITERRRILLVDDEPVIRDLCSRVLKEHRVFQAASGQEALAFLAREEVDIVLTDIMMPAMSGLELLQAIKSRHPNQAVVVMTGFTEKEVILQALKANADDFISKPINLLQLRTTIDKVIEKQALKEELLQLKRMDRLKSDFLGLISHKLKTPTTAISLFIQNVAHGIGDPEDPSFQRTLKLILEESAHLNDLIQDLLYFSEVILEEGPPRLVATSLDDIVRQALLEARKAGVAKGITVTSALRGPLPVFSLDVRRIAFVLKALLDNAVKFTPEGGTVAVTGGIEEQAVRLSVRDSGPGIPREELNKIFEKFYQIDPEHTGQIRGFGLGLFYARQFMQNHRGTLTLESEPGKGTVATLLLPDPRLRRRQAQE